jgi:hypothetical protein
MENGKNRFNINSNLIMNENWPNFEEVVFDIENKIAEAKDNAPNMEEVEKMEPNEAEEVLARARFKVESLYELKLALKMIGFSDESMIDTLAHENAHANEAQAQGVKHTGYNITIVKYGGKFAVHPSAGVYVPDEWPKVKQDDVMRKIITAPERYGNSLSEDDLKKLEDLR